jgi:hypothetical protein
VNLNSRVGVVVPTLGTRPGLLEQSLLSIREAGDAFVVLVSPKGFDSTELMRTGLVDSSVQDDGRGLPAAINKGVASFPTDVLYVNWLGDDDLLTPGSLGLAAAALDADHEVLMAFGSCEYINTEGVRVWKNRSGQWAVPLLRFGPDLIPQPGALFRRSAFASVEGLSLHYDWAFDFDLFIKFSKLGKLKYIDATLAKFRWHPTSLSVEFRRASVREASKVRVSHLPNSLKLISNIWEAPVRIASLWAGVRLTRHSNQITSREHKN